MRQKLVYVIFIALLAGSAEGATNQPTAVYTFLCSGSASQRIGACPAGASPNFLMQGSDGNYYGTTALSAVGETSLNGGIVFSLTPAGKFSLLHTFVSGTNKNFANGQTPVSLTEGSDGNLYGITQFGGNPAGKSFANYGVLFRISKTGANFQVIHRFCSAVNCVDGGRASGALVAGQDGNLYGATMGGGGGCPAGGCGAIFRVTPSTGKYQVVFAFGEQTGFPYGVNAAPDGTFYGVIVGGEYLYHYVPATGTVEQTQLSFPFPAGCPGFACFVTGVMAFGPNGNLYGFYSIYDQPGIGTFELQTDGSHLQIFPTLTTGGPQLLLASDGNFWFPESLGANGFGDIVTLSPADGTVMHTLAPFSTLIAAGANPNWLIQAPDGTLFGTTSAYGHATQGHFADGTVFHLNAGLPAPQ